jgi:hypothetical protein
MEDQMRQYAPYPAELADLVAGLKYKSEDGWTSGLVDVERDHAGVHTGPAGGLTLVIVRVGPDTYDHGRILRVGHYFPVPAATYDRRSWQRWLFERVRDVETHEAMEHFVIDGKRPYAPSHGPGNDPYMVRETGTDMDRRTAYTGEVNPA